MKVLLILEDPTNDGHIAKPVVEAILADLKISARTDVLSEPRLRGAAQALDKETLEGIISDNPMIDAFVLVVDRDCDRGGHVALARTREAEHPNRLIACLAVEEIEVWLLAINKQSIDCRWTEIREHCDPKDRWADPFLASLRSAGPGGGRKKAMQALTGKLRSLLTLCDELKELRERLSVFHSS